MPDVRVVAAACGGPGPSVPAKPRVDATRERRRCNPACHLLSSHDAGASEQSRSAANRHRSSPCDTAIPSRDRLEGCTVLTARKIHAREANVFQRVHQYPLFHYDGRSYRPRAYGQPQPDGGWGGWVVFFPLDGNPAVATDRETTQRTFQSLRVWAAGLTSTYLEGALVRALQLAAEPLILADLDEAEYAALEDAEALQTAADLERATANVDEAAAAAARASAERIRDERLAAESALAAADEAAATVQADLHERAAGQARAVAADAARRRRETQTAATRRTGPHRSSRKKK
jgi:hypothetical protein